jgi:two-component sensor histidine kinase
MIEARNRIAAMSIVHEMLYQSPDLGEIPFDAYIRELAPSIVSSYGHLPKSIGLIFETDPILLDIGSAIPCSLILNELISNSVTHAFPVENLGRSPCRQFPYEREGPSITIRLRSVAGSVAASGNSLDDSLIRKDSPSDIQGELTVEDNGIGFPFPTPASTVSGLGLKLVETLALQIGGSMQVHSKGGTSVFISFPLGRKGNQ